MKAVLKMLTGYLKRVLVILLVILQIYMVFLIFRYPMPGLSIEKNQENWFISLLDRFGVATSIGIEVGDHVLWLNGRHPSDYWSVNKWGGIHQVDSITILQDGKPETFSTKNIPAIIIYDMFALIAEAISFILAYIVYKKLSQFSSSKFLSIVFFDIGLIFLCLAGSSRGDPTGKILITFCMMLLPVLFYHFLQEFFKEKKVNTYSLLPMKRWFYLVIVLVNSLQLVYYTDFYNIIFQVNQIVIPLTLYVGVLGMLVNFGALIYVYMKNRNGNPQGSTIIKTVFASLFCSFFPVITFSFIPNLVFDHEWLNSFYMSLFVFIFPLTFVYLLATRRLYDIDMIMRRLLFTLVIAFIPSVFFAGVVKLLALEITVERLVLIFVIFWLGITALLYSLENLTSKLEPWLFPRKHRLQLALKKISRNLGTISSLRELRDVILVDMVETLEVLGGAVAFRYTNGETEVVLEGNIDQDQVEKLVCSGSMEHEHYMCFEVSRQEEFTSFLIMSQKKTYTALGAEEVQWLNLIITYLASSLENIHLIQKLNDRLQQLSSLLPDEKEARSLNWFRKLMFELQERERIRIATDLHDTTMQDLFFLKSRLHHMEQEYGHTEEERKSFRSLTEYIDIINTSLRQSCFELHPYLLREIGLVKTLNKLFRTEEALCGFKISFVATEVSEIEELEMETKRHLFRMVQELLNNAKKHSKASIVRFSVSIDQGTLYFEYMDDGVGFEPQQLAEREIGSSGMGMEQMKSRVLSLGGQYELISSKGHGMRFEASFPLQEAGRQLA